MGFNTDFFHFPALHPNSTATLPLSVNPQPLTKFRTVALYSVQIIIVLHLALLTAFTNIINHVAHGSTTDWMILCEPTRDLNPALSPSCVAKVSLSGLKPQAFFDRGCLHRQFASISPAPRARRCDQFTVGTSRSMTKPVEPSLYELCRYTCKMEVES